MAGTTKRDPKIDALNEVLVEAAYAGAQEITHFLKTWRGKDPDGLRRVMIASGAVKNYTQYRASYNNLIAMMLGAARQTGLSRADTLDIVKNAGLLPPSAKAAEAES